MGLASAAETYDSKLHSKQFFVSVLFIYIKIFDVKWQVTWPFNHKRSHYIETSQLICYDGNIGR